MRIAGKPLLLVILDGWGMPTGEPGDAISQADLPNFNRLWAQYPHTCIGASGPYVGLPEGQMGDSEVGHMNIGSGRVIYQEAGRITNAIADGRFFQHPVLIEAIEKAKSAGGALHLFGLLSDGGIHSHIKHLFALLRLAKEQAMDKVYIHCFADGRDTPPQSLEKYIRLLEEEMAAQGVGEIASIIGRFYAMDRDKRWERVQKAYNLMVYGQGRPFTTAEAAIADSYARNISDEFMEPMVMTHADGTPKGLVQTGDSLIFYNYRSDRAREISHVFSDEDFNFFNRGENPPRVHYVCMTSYDDSLKAPVAFTPQPPVNTLGKVISNNNMRQLRIAETEKYAHVTFFFNGGVERMDVGEDRVMIPSPNVATYDLLPEMNCSAVTRATIDRIGSGIYDFIVLNYANPDMVGHTGNLQATITALQAVDCSLGQIEQAVKEAHGTLIVTADHGNVEKMQAEDGKPFTTHTTNLVPFILVDDGLRQVELRSGRLEDIAPTVLQLLGLRQPAEMTGSSLIAAGLQQYSQIAFEF